MKKISLILLLAILGPLCLIAQNAPIDFEENGHGAEWSWKTFENDDDPPLEVIDNPDPTGINLSLKVAKFTARVDGAPFVGCESKHGTDIGTFTIDPNNPSITIMVYKSIISDVGIKLVEASNASLGELKIANTKVNEWEKLVFDFSSRVGITYDQIVIFPDFQSRNSENIIYFDNITFGNVNASISELKQKNRIEIFPNPANNVLNIDNFRDSYSVINSYGIKILEGETRKLDISHLAAGIYFLKAIGYDGANSFHKFIKN